MKKQKSIWKRMTLYSYLLLFFWFVICLLSGNVIREQVLNKNVYGTAIIMIFMIIFIFIWFKELYSSLGLKWIVVEK